MNRRRRSFDTITTLFLNVVLLLWVTLAVVLWFATDDRPSLRLVAIIAMILFFTGAAGTVLGAAAEELFPERTSVGESASKETAHHPRAIAEEVGDRPFAVVTSAFHMPWSMRVFRRNGLSPVAYPAGYLVSRRNRLIGLIPSSKGLELTQLALTEYAANLFDAVIRP